ncbi:hypothetical protein ACFL2D_00060 [Patescibacteria group bacterium]
MSEGENKDMGASKPDADLDKKDAANPDVTSDTLDTPDTSVIDSVESTEGLSVPDLRTTLAEKASRQVQILESDAGVLIQSGEITPDEEEDLKRGVKEVHEAYQELTHAFAYGQLVPLLETYGYETKPNEEGIDPVIDRLAFMWMPPETGKKQTHFEDAIDIQRMTELMYDGMEGILPKEELERLRLASLVHDVGKTGPESATEEEQRAVMELFNIDFDNEEAVARYGVRAGELTMRQAVNIAIDREVISPERADKVLELIEKATRSSKRPETKLTEESQMIDFWGAHVYWSYDILKKSEVNEDLAKLVGSHHILEGRNPAGLAQDEVDTIIATLELADKYHSLRGAGLIMLDRYQAARMRGGKTHEEAVEYLYSSLNHSPHGLSRTFEKNYHAATGEMAKEVAGVMKKFEKDLAAELPDEDADELWEYFQQLQQADLDKDDFMANIALERMATKLEQTSDLKRKYEKLSKKIQNHLEQNQFYDIRSLYLGIIGVIAEKKSEFDEVLEKKKSLLDARGSEAAE